jgi:hypothetical protein
MLHLPNIVLTPSEMDTLDRIGAAFHSRLDRDGAAPVVVTLGLVTLILVSGRSGVPAVRSVEPTFASAATRH